MQVVDNGAATQIKPVLAQPAGASTPPLPIGHMSQSVLDGHPLAQLGPSQRRLLAGTRLRQERLVGMHVQAAALGAGRLDDRATVTSMSATMSASRTSDLRQTISVLTTKHTSTRASAKAMVYAA